MSTAVDTVVDSRLPSVQGVTGHKWRRKLIRKSGSGARKTQETFRDHQAAFGVSRTFFRCLSE
jgi:hypothetical protein